MAVICMMSACNTTNKSIEGIVFLYVRISD